MKMFYFCTTLNYFQEKKNPAANKLDTDLFICGAGQHIFLLIHLNLQHIFEPCTFLLFKHPPRIYKA